MDAATELPRLRLAREGLLLFFVVDAISLLAEAADFVFFLYVVETLPAGAELSGTTLSAR